MKTGTRVQLHPATDRWIMGDRYGEVVKITKRYVTVLLDKSHKRIRLVHMMVTEI